LATEKELAQYNRFRAKRLNPNTVECPSCESLVIGNPETPITQCTECGHGFCLYHGDLHGADITCEEYEHENRKEGRINRAALAATTKPCPKCSSPVEKSGGCNQIKCLVCDASFCWICGQDVDEAVLPDHFKWYNVFGCPGMQMNQSIGTWSPTKIIVFRIIYLILALATAPLAFVTSIVFMTLFVGFWLPLCILGDYTPFGAFLGCFTISGYGFIFALGLVGLFPLLLVLSPFAVVSAMVFRPPQNTPHTLSSQFQEKPLSFTEEGVSSSQDLEDPTAG